MTGFDEAKQFGNWEEKYCVLGGFVGTGDIVL